MFIKYPYKIQIYRVKPWCIYFKYEGDYYMLNTSYDEDTFTRLYKKELNEYGNYEMVFLKGCYGDFYYRNYMGKPYKFINTNRFVYELTIRGLIYSAYSKSLTKRTEIRMAIKQQIEDLEKKLRVI